MIHTNWKNERGMSTLMGIVLLVVITAILATMVSVIALSSSNFEESKLIRVTVDRIEASSGPGTGVILVENKGGFNVEMLKQGGPGVDCFRVYASGVQASTVTYPPSAPTTAYAGPQVGSVQYYQAESGAEVIVVACYIDNTEYQVWTGVVP